MMTSFSLYPEISPFQTELLQVDRLHHIYIEQCGRDDGIPVLFLHGGPGSGCNAGQRRFFDPNVYRIVLFDQRGCGRSIPAGETLQNTTHDLVSDIETIRLHLGISRWHVFGGSWGSTLALAYACKHPEAVTSLTLRGIFLSRAVELNWFLGQVSLFFPEAWQHLLSGLPENEQHDPLHAYGKRVFATDKGISIPAAIRWNQFESSIMRLIPQAETSETQGEVELARARVQIHYIQHACFVDGNALLQQATQQLANIPTIIVQGRYDMVCPPVTAWALSQALPHAKLVMVPDAGHSAMETGTMQALVAATETFKSLTP